MTVDSGVSQHEGPARVDPARRDLGGALQEAQSIDRCLVDGLPGVLMLSRLDSEGA